MLGDGEGDLVKYRDGFHIFARASKFRGHDT